jgi:pyruvate, water dikinase
MKSIQWLQDITFADAATVGGKAANLGELSAAGFPVPAGFVITRAAFLDPSGQKNEILDAYHRLDATARVAVRSSATEENGAAASSGATFTNVSGDEEVLTSVVECAKEPALAVIVQEMIPSECSGVVFTCNAATGSSDEIVVEAVFGQGAVLVSGEVEPDRWIVVKPALAIESAHTGHKILMIVRDHHGHDAPVPLTGASADEPVLTDEQVLELARLALRVEEHYGCPQLIEWARADGATYLLRSRPMTALAEWPEVTAELTTVP